MLTISNQIINSNFVQGYSYLRNNVVQKQNITTVINFKGRALKNKNLINLETPIQNVFNDFLTKIKENSDGLNKNDRKMLAKKLKDIEGKLKELSNLKLQVGRLFDYDNLKKEGVPSSVISKYVKEDDTTIKKAQEYSNRIQKSKEYMFGYPANIGTDTALIQNLRNMEAELPLINGCGDSYELGNYVMNAKKDYEQPILKKIYKHLGLNPPKIKLIKQVTPDGAIKKVFDYQGPWGYISQGGSESNRWGITNGLRKYPEAIVYYSTAAHYSVPKSVKRNTCVNNKINTLSYVDSEAIATEQNSEKINVNELISRIKINWETNKKPAVILLTWGTTKTGAIDDVKKISKQLNNLKIDHYIHLDAAMYGGIAKNQTNAPVLPNIKN